MGGKDTSGAKRAGGLRRGAGGRGGKRARWLLPVVLGLSALVAFILAKRHAPEEETQKRLDWSGLGAKLRARSYAAAADAVVAECSEGKEHTCGCGKLAVSSALDADLHATAIEVLDALSADCAGRLELRALWAEALARSQMTQAAQVKAQEVLAKKPTEPHALFATALIVQAADSANAAAPGDEESRAQKAKSAEALARSAAEHGRGAPALAFVAGLRLGVGDLDGADQAAEQALKVDPVSADALFLKAHVAERRNRYGPAREGYLRVLRARADFAMARYRLAAMSRGIGAREESLHHQRKLVELDPNSPLVPLLERELAEVDRRKQAAAAEKQLPLKMRGPGLPGAGALPGEGEGKAQP